MPPCSRVCVYTCACFNLKSFNCLRLYYTDTHFGTNHVGLSEELDGWLCSGLMDVYYQINKSKENLPSMFLEILIISLKVTTTIKLQCYISSNVSTDEFQLKFGIEMNFIANASNRYDINNSKFKFVLETLCIRLLIDLVGLILER